MNNTNDVNIFFMLAASFYIQSDTGIHPRLVSMILGALLSSLCFWNCKAANSLGSQQFISNNGSVVEERIVSVNSDGQPSAFSTATSVSNCVLRIGCYKPRLNARPTLFTLSPLSLDPLTCFETCVSKNFTFAGISGSSCGCSQSLLRSFDPILSPTCSSGDDHWSVYGCFTYEQLSSLAVDPWRSVAFKVVIVDWLLEDPDSPRPDAQPREGYFLFASDVTSSKPLLEYMLPLSAEEALSGLMFDADSSRLVALTASYRLAVVTIDSTDSSHPILALTTHKLFTDPITREDMFSSPPDVVPGTQVSGIISRNGIDSYVFAVPYGPFAHSLLLFVDLSPKKRGQVFHSVQLDCVATQLAINEYYGDVAVLASRQSSIQFIAVATVFRAPNGELSVNSYWDPTGANLLFVAAVADTQNLNLLAGVSVSIPMQNQSCHGIMLYGGTGGNDDRQVLLNQPLSSADSKGESVPSVVCFDIRHQGLFALWGSANGTARTVANGTVQTAVTMNLYQSDPGFPMTLSRPEMTLCELSLTGLVVSVKFDAVTLMGGLAVDVDKDGIPDLADLSTQVLVPQPASVCFSDSSSTKLAGATCQFLQSDLLVVTLDSQQSTLTFNDALCIRPNFLCRNSGVQWSNYANGCCTVARPQDLVAPKPVLAATPALVVDVCSDLVLDLSDSLFCGRACRFAWKVVSVVVPGPTVASADLVKAGLQQLLSEQPSNAGTVRISSSQLLSGAKHYLVATVTSSWQLSASLNVTVEKLTQPAPTVAIQGDPRLVRTQMADYSLTAVGRVSGCSSSSQQPAQTLTYQWTMTNCSAVLTTPPASAIITTQNVLRIPAGTHVCPPTGAWIDNGRVVCEQCVAAVSVALATDTSLRSAAQSVTVQIVKSAIVVKCVNPDSALVTRGPVWFVNCGNSVDPDNPTASPFQGTFSFNCVSSGSGQPCFGQSKTMAEMPSCVADYAQARVVGDGGALYPQIVFNATDAYCRVSRGVVAVNTALLAEGAYTVTIDVVHFDGLRAATKQLAVALSGVVMPKVSLAVVAGANGATGGKYPVSFGLKIEATSTLAGGAATYTWQLLTKQRNPAFDADIARLALARGEVYNVAQFVYLPVDTLVVCRAANKAQWTDSSPTLAISAYCLQAATQYALRLTLQWPDPRAPSVSLSTFSELLFETASGPPKNGILAVSATGVATCDHAKTLTAEGWTSEDTPLAYKFGYLLDTGGSKYWLSDSAQQVRTFTTLLPCGNVTVFVQITSAAGESAFGFADVKSPAPADAAAAAASLLTRAEAMLASDPAQAFSHLMAAVSLNSTAETVSRAAAAVETTQCASADCGDRQLVFLNTLAGTLRVDERIAPRLVEGLLAAVERNVERISLTSTSGIEQTQTVFNSLSALTAAVGTVAVQRRSSPGAELRTPTMATGRFTATVMGNCESLPCRTVGQSCMRQLPIGHRKEICLDSLNVAGGCVDPPCWWPVGLTTIHREDNDTPSSLLRVQAKEAGSLQDARARRLSQSPVRKSTEETALRARIVTARDRIVKKLILTLVKDQAPAVFETPQFRITVGKATDMNATLPALAFPAAFSVPRNAPDNPSPENPVTGFSFMLVEYVGNPFGAETGGSVISLAVMKANPDIPLVVSPSERPVRVWADKDLLAADRCLVWNGEQWSGEGAVNDGKGCLVDQFGDFAVFVDTATIRPNVTTESGYVDGAATAGGLEVSLAAMGLYIGLAVAHAALAFWGRRMDRKTQDPPTSVHLDGDGITTALSLDDPIPYDQAGAAGWARLVWLTLINLLVRRHVLAWPFTFHPIMSRPLRVLLCFEWTAACMSAAALLADGFLSSLLAYPLYLAFWFMAAHRPHPAALRPAKGLRKAKAAVPGPPPTPRSVDLRFGMMPVGPPVRLLSRTPRESSVPPPPPPPPLTEDAPMFIRRVQNVYAEKSQHEHLKTVIAADSQGLSHPVPQWVELASAIVLYSALVGWVCVSAVLVCVLLSGGQDMVFLVTFAAALGYSACIWETLVILIDALIQVRRFKLRLADSDSAHTNPPVAVRPDTPSSVTSTFTVDDVRTRSKSPVRTLSPVWHSPAVQSREHSPIPRSSVMPQGVLLPGRTDFTPTMPGSPTLRSARDTIH